MDQAPYLRVLFYLAGRIASLVGATVITITIFRSGSKFQKFSEMLYHCGSMIVWGNELYPAAYRQIQGRRKRYNSVDRQSGRSPDQRLRHISKNEAAQKIIVQRWVGETIMVSFMDAWWHDRYIGVKRGLFKTIFSNPQYWKLMVLSPADLHFIFPKQLVLVLSFHLDFQTFSPAPSSSHHLNPSPNGSSKMIMYSMSQKLTNIPSLYLALILI